MNIETNKQDFLDLRDACNLDKHTNCSYCDFNILCHMILFNRLEKLRGHDRGQASDLTDGDIEEICKQSSCNEFKIGDS